DGYIRIDAYAGESGSTLTIGGKLTNNAVVYVGTDPFFGPTTLSAASFDNAGYVLVYAGATLDITGDLGLEGDSLLSVESGGTLTTGALTTVLKTGAGTTSIIDLEGQSFESQYKIVVESGAL